MSVLLQVNSVGKYFGGLKALQDVSFNIEEKATTGIIGPNGSGKTTLVNVITGFYKPDTGNLVFDGTDITGWSPDRVLRKGIARTFQGLRVFSNLSLNHNIHMAQVALKDLPEKNTQTDLLERLNLASKQGSYVKNLSLFDQRKLEVAMKLISDPRLLILDEPTAGLNPDEVSFFLDFIRELEKNMTIIIIEHSIKVITMMAKNLLVLKEGVKIADGPANSVINSRAVIEAWIGV